MRAAVWTALGSLPFPANPRDVWYQPRLPGSCISSSLLEKRRVLFFFFFFYSLSPATGSGVTQSTTKKGSTCIKSIRDWPQSWKSFRSPLSCAGSFIWVFDMEYLLF